MPLKRYKMLGYMVTWTAYGSWLQGDERGYVKDGEVLAGCTGLREANRKEMKEESKRFSKKERAIIDLAIKSAAEQIGIVILALSVCGNHVHAVIENNGMEIGHVVRRLKNSATASLREHGVSRRLWTNGYDKRYCFDRKQLDIRIRYVARHDDGR